MYFFRTWFFPNPRGFLQRQVFRRRLGNCFDIQQCEDEMGNGLRSSCAFLSLYTSEHANIPAGHKVNEAPFAPEQTCLLFILYPSSSRDRKAVNIFISIP